MWSMPDLYEFECEITYYFTNIMNLYVEILITKIYGCHVRFKNNLIKIK